MKSGDRNQLFNAEKFYIARELKIEGLRKVII
jgi:hypothetical protein